MSAWASFKAAFVDIVKPPSEVEVEAARNLAQSCIVLKNSIDLAKKTAPEEAIRKVTQAKAGVVQLNNTFRETYPASTRPPKADQVAALVAAADQSISRAQQVRDCKWTDIKNKDRSEIEEVLSSRSDALRQKQGELIDPIEFKANSDRLEKELVELEKAPNPDAPEIREKIEQAKKAEQNQADPRRYNKALGLLDTAELLVRKAQGVKRSTGQAEEEENKRLDQLKLINLTPEQAKKLTPQQIEEKLNEIAKENESFTPEERFERMTETEFLFNNPNPKIQNHAALLLHRGQALGLSDSQPLLIQYAYQLARGKNDGDRDKMAKLGAKLCQRMVAKDLFGRYVSDLLTGTSAVEQLQKKDATKYYFWSLTNKNVDARIAATKNQITERLEKSAAASLFDDLNFDQGWDDNAGNFRVIFEQISEDYAKKAIAVAQEQQNAKIQAGGPVIVITALRGPNTGAVLGKTEWPALREKINANNLPFQFDVYYWGGDPKNFNVPLPKYTIFNDDRFKLPCFDQNASGIAKSLTKVGEVDSLIFHFESYDEMTQCGGPHLAGKGKDSAFAVMPCAYIKTTANGELLVGKQDAGSHIFILNKDGTTARDTGLDEAAFLSKCDTDPV